MRGYAPSLKFWLTLTIGTLAFLPNLIVIFVLSRSSPELLAQQNVRIAVWLLSVGFFATAIGYLLANRLLAPLDELTRSLRYLKVSSRTLADLSLPPPKTQLPQEVATLREQFETLIHHLRGLTESREAVFATLAHDLKTPLIAAVRATSYLIDADEISREQRIQMLRQLQEEFDRTYRLVENLLTASKLETTRPQLELVNIGAMLDDLRLRYLKDAAKRGIAIEVTGSGETRADRMMLERAGANLIENALRHARNRIILRAGPGFFEVEDDGPGLPAPLESLSQPFHSKKLKGVRSGSSGLGLYIARQVAELHKGVFRSCQGTLGGACIRLEANDRRLSTYTLL
ncbi:sensor histidine kinase [Oceanithermus sp.]